MNTPWSVEFDLHIDRERRGRKQLREGQAPIPAPARVPRVAKLLALAHRFERLVRDGKVADYATLARAGHVTRARLSQIMALLNLAPDIQEAVLFLPRVERGRDPIIVADLMPIATELDWRKQRRMWRDLPGGRLVVMEYSVRDRKVGSSNLLASTILFTHAHRRFRR